MPIHDYREPRAMATSLDGSLAFNLERSFFAGSAYDKLHCLSVPPCFNVIAIRKTKHAMTANSITPIGPASPVLTFRRKLHSWALMFSSVIGEFHPAIFELLCCHPVPIVNDHKRVLFCKRDSDINK